MYSYNASPESDIYVDCDLEPLPPPPMNPGDVYFFSANSYVLCVKRTPRAKTYQQDLYLEEPLSSLELVTTKNHGLNPNANEFHSKVPSSPEAATALLWNDGIGSTDAAPSSALAGTSPQMVAAEDYSYMNGEVADGAEMLVASATLQDAPPDDSLLADNSLEVTDDAVRAHDETYAALDDDGYVGDDSGAETTANAAALIETATTSDEAAATPQTVAAELVESGGVSMSPVSAAGPSTAVTVTSSASIADEPTSSAAPTQEPAVVTAAAASAISGDLRKQLRDQLEYYFSPENLAIDSYLYSQMDADHFVSIATIANFNMVKRLTNDLGLIVDVLKESPVVQVDDAGEKVRPLHKRCIVILREVPQSTPVEIVEELFSGENCPRFISCEFAINNSWYITFDSDEDAQRAYRYLREEKQTFLGRPIMARIKAKPLLRSTYVPKNGVQKHVFSPTASLNAAQFTPAAAAAVVVAQQAVPAGAGAGAAQVQYTTTPTSSYSPPIQPAIGYINSQPQQSYSAFFPSPGATMVPWQPPAQFYDPGLVFAVNGYQAQATFKHGPTRPYGFQPIRPRNQAKPPTGRNHNMAPSMERNHIESARPSAYDRQHSAPPAPSSSHRPSSARSTDSYHGGPANSGRLDGPARRESGGGGGHWRDSYQNHYSNNHMDSYPPRLEKELSRRLPYRSRAVNRRRDDDTGATKPSTRSTPPTPPSMPTSGGNGGGGGSGGPSPRPAAHSPRFELEPTNFPPLPGAHSNNMSGDVFENKMSDVVRGTAKPSTRDHRPPSGSDSSPVKCDVNVSVSSTTSVKHAPSVASTSPKKNEKNYETSKNMPEKSTSASTDLATSANDVVGGRPEPVASIVKASARSARPSSTSSSSSSSGAVAASGGRAPAGTASAATVVSATASGASTSSSKSPSSSTPSSASAASSTAASSSSSSSCGGATSTTVNNSISKPNTTTSALTVNTGTIATAGIANGNSVTTSSASQPSNAANSKPMPAKEEKSTLNHLTSPPIPSKISYAQMVARSQPAGAGSDSDSGPLSPTGDDDSTKDDQNDASSDAAVAAARTKDVPWERRDEPREQRYSRRYRETRDRRERRSTRSPTK